jgi:hypothetical protein
MRKGAEKADKTGSYLWDVRWKTEDGATMILADITMSNSERYGRKCLVNELSSKIILTNNLAPDITCRAIAEVFFCSC